jgi:uncharacterized protein YcbK (DUF882 family)
MFNFSTLIYNQYSRNSVMTTNPIRRRLLVNLSAVLLTGATTRLLMAARAPMERRLSFSSLHTGETLDTTFWIAGEYQIDALGEINHILRDWRAEETHPIDTGLLELLFDLRIHLNSTRSFEIISGYRSPATNRALRNRSNGVARSSLHMQGMAVDIRLPGRELKVVRNAAMALRRGGVGYYPHSGFVHVDTGRVRRWG